MEPERLPPTTAEEFFAIPDTGARLELVAGEVHEMAPPGYEHGLLAMRLAARVAQVVEQQGLGDLLGAETGFRLSREPDTVRAPDLAFIAAARAPRPRPVTYGEIMPDLVAEVVSPSDSAGAVARKVWDWLGAGVGLVWVVYPDASLVSVHTIDSTRLLSETDELTAPDLLPGFSLSLTELFA